MEKRLSCRDFSGSDSGRLLGIGIGTTASWLSLGVSRLLGGPTRLVNFCVLIGIGIGKAWS